MESDQVVLIVAAPGDLQAGLQVLVTKLPEAEVLAVSAGQAALGAMARHQPSVVILDKDLPGIHGLALAGQIKERWPAVRCLVLLNYLEEREEALAKGADAALVKGFPAARLISVVEQLLVAGEAEDAKTLV